MPTNCVSSNGVFHAIYPSYVVSQNVLLQFILASSLDGGNCYHHKSVFSTLNGTKTH